LTWSCWWSTRRPASPTISTSACGRRRLPRAAASSACRRRSASAASFIRPGCAAIPGSRSRSRAARCRASRPRPWPRKSGKWAAPGFSRNTAAPSAQWPA
jgi:hypothetical protein